MKVAERGLRVLYVARDAESAWILDKRSKFQQVLDAYVSAQEQAARRKRTIYGGLAHSNEKKWEIHERWKANPLRFAYVQQQFGTIIMTALHAIACVCNLSERKLATQEGAPH